MRSLVFVALALLAGCATVPGDLPTPHYADAASRGAVSAFLAGRPSQAQVDAAAQKWSAALGDSVACGAPMRKVIDAGLVGALEIGAMDAASHGGGRDAVREGVGRYVSKLASLLVEQRPRPDDARCSALAQWAPQTAEAGREAVQRARHNGLMNNDYGLLMDLMTR
jgi:hypothetical protein